MANGTANQHNLASLYVGDLSPDVSEAVLYELFNEIGPVASIRVCRDSITRKSLGYAYVNFHSVPDAERAIDELNYTSIKGQSCRIMWSHRDPSTRRNDTKGNIFVKNLSKTLDNKALYETFSLFGPIRSCKVATDKEGKSRGYGFVDFDSEKSAQQAIDQLNGYSIGDKIVYVGHFIRRDERQKVDIVNFTNIYVKHIPDEMADEELHDAFKEFGSVTSHVVMKDNKGRRFAFVNFEKVDDAKVAIEKMNRKDMRQEADRNTLTDEEANDDNHPSFLLYVSRAQTKTERESGLKDKYAKETQRHQATNLYIKNLDETVTDAMIEAMFAQYGKVVSAHAALDDKGKCKGFGFVSFSSPEESKAAVTDMHLKTVMGRPLYVGLAERKTERQARLQQRYRGGPGMKGVMHPGARPGLPPNAGLAGAMANTYLNTNPYMAAAAVYAAAQPRPGSYLPPRSAAVAGARPMYPGSVVSMVPNMMPKGMMPGKGMVPGTLVPGAHAAAANGAHAMMNAAQQPGARNAAAAGPLSGEALARANPSLQKQILGERLFPRVQSLQPELAGKITGMMLEMDNAELLHLLESDVQLKSKVDEAMRVLHQVRTN